METKIIKSETVYSAKYFKIEKKVIVRNGKTFTKEFIERNAVVAIIPYTKEHEVYLESQYRDAFSKHLLEVVAGTIEDGGDPLETAKRELAEETGLRAQTWKQLAEWETSANMNAKVYVFAATDLEQGEPNTEEDEEIETIKMPLTEAIEKVVQGEISVGFHAAVLLLFEKLLKEGKL